MNPHRRSGRSATRARCSRRRPGAAIGASTRSTAGGRRTASYPHPNCASIALPAGLLRDPVRLREQAVDLLLEREVSGRPGTDSSMNRLSNRPSARVKRTSRPGRRRCAARIAAQFGEGRRDGLAVAFAASSVVEPSRTSSGLASGGVATVTGWCAARRTTILLAATCGRSRGRIMASMAALADGRGGGGWARLVGRGGDEVEGATAWCWPGCRRAALSVAGTPADMSERDVLQDRSMAAMASEALSA